MWPIWLWVLEGVTAVVVISGLVTLIRGELEPAAPVRRRAPAPAPAPVVRTAKPAPKPLASKAAPLAATAKPDSRTSLNDNAKVSLSKPADRS